MPRVEGPVLDAMHVVLRPRLHVLPAGLPPVSDSTLEALRDAVRFAWRAYEKEHPTFGRWALRYAHGFDRSLRAAQACYDWAKNSWTAPAECAAACLAVVTWHEAQGLVGLEKDERLAQALRYCEYVQGKRSQP